MGALIAYFARRPLIVNVLMIAAILGGLIATRVMNAETMPQIDMGTVSISTVDPGAGAEDVELSITAPIEEEVLSVDGIDKLTSSSMEGISSITVTLDPDLEGDAKKQALTDLQKAVDRAASKLPTDLPQKPSVTELSSSKVPVMELHVAGDVPEETLRVVSRQLSEGLRELDGVAGVDKVGMRDREVRVMLDPEKLHHLGVSIDEIRGAITRRNVRESGGALEAFATEKQILTVGQFDSPRDVEEVIIRSRGPGNDVRIRDVAEVVLDYNDWGVQSRSDGQLAIVLSPRKKADADGIATAQQVRGYIDSAQQNLPPGVELRMVNDISRFTYDMLDMLLSNALLGCALVFLVLRLFFDGRMAFWVSVGLPVAICLTFCGMALCDLNLDLLTLTALILMLGMLVDDAIVSGESIYHAREQGMSPLEASTKGAQRVAPPVLVSALTTMLAFAPIAFLGGLEGKFLWSIPVVVTLTLVGSLIECQWMLPAHLAHGPNTPVTQRGWFLALRRAYGRLIRLLIRRRFVTIGVFCLGLVGIGAFGATAVGFNLYPESEADQFVVEFALPQGTPLETTRERAEQIEQMIRDEVPAADLVNVSTRLGQGGGGALGGSGGSDPAKARMTAYLPPPSERSIKSSEVVKTLRAQFDALKGFEQLDVSASGGKPTAGAPVEVEIISGGPGRLAVADAMVAFLDAHEGVTAVDTSYKPGKSIVELELHHDAIAARGLSVRDITDAVRIAFDGATVDEVRTPEETVRFRLQYARRDQGKLKTLKGLTLLNSQGKKVRLDGLVTLHERPGQAAIRRYFGRRAITVTAQIDRDAITVEAINREVREHLAASGLLTEYPDVRLHYGGEFEQQQAALGGVALAFLACITGIFLVLLLLFGSVTQPFLILIVLPFGLSGAIPGLALSGMDLSMMAMVGLLGLAGVLVNDSVVMVSSLNERKGERPMLTHEELCDGAEDRLRPILLTSLTTVAGLFPTAYGIAGSNQFVAPMVVAMAWGVLFGTFVSLMLLPALYAVEQDLRRAWGKIVGLFRRSSVDTSV